MRLVPVPPTTIRWVVCCFSCGRRVNQAHQPLFADLDGPAYKAYYCEPCATALQHAAVPDFIKTYDCDLTVREYDPPCGDSTRWEVTAYSPDGEAFMLNQVAKLQTSLLYTQGSGLVDDAKAQGLKVSWL